MVKICYLGVDTTDFVKEMTDLFKTALPIQPKLILVESRDEFDSLFGSSTKDRPWLVAFVLKNNIVIFSQEVLEKETTHKLQEWKELIKHEIIHLFYFTKFKTHQPVWLNEGLAVYLSGQEKSDVKVDLNDMLNLFTLQNFNKDKDSYGKSLKFVKNLLGEK